MIESIYITELFTIFDERYMLLTVYFKHILYEGCKMRKRVILFGLVFLFLGSVVLTFAIANRSGYQNTIWKEVPIEEGKTVINTIKNEFDLKNLITNADFVFSGIVVNRQEFEVSWHDDNGDNWGPFPSSIIEVKINEIYFGESPVGTETIKIYYPNSLSAQQEYSFNIVSNNEYIFVSKLLDEEFVKYKNKYAPDDKFNQEDYADVYIEDTSYNILPIKNGDVYFNKKYFSWDKDLLKQAEVNITTKKEIAELGDFDNDWCISCKTNKFNKYFNKMLGEPEKLPNLEEADKYNRKLYGDEIEY